MNFVSAAFYQMVFAVFGATTLFAAPINWSLKGPVAKESDVLTKGKLVYAQYWDTSGKPLSVGGVQFAPGFTDCEAQAVVPSTDPSVFSGDTGSLSYNTMLSRGVWHGTGQDDSDTVKLTLKGLTSGTKYVIQIWALDDRDGFSARTVAFSDGTNYSQSALQGSNTIFVGTFTADSPTQDIIITATKGQAASSGVMLQAFQVRELNLLDEQ